MKTYNSNHLSHHEEQHAEAKATFFAQKDALETARNNLRTEEKNLRAQQDHYNPSHSTIAYHQRVVDEARRRVERLVAAVDRVAVRNTVTNTTLRAIKAYITQSMLKPSDHDFESDYPTPKVAVSQIPKAVETVRAEIVVLKAKRQAIVNHHVPREVPEALIEAEFANAASLVGTAVSPALFQPGGNASGTVMWLINTGSDMHPEQIFQINPRLLLAAIAKDARAMYLRDIGAFYEKNGPGISDEDRRASVAALDQQIEGAEQREEALIRAAEAGGVTIDRRTDASPAAMLGPIMEETVEEVPYDAPRGHARIPDYRRQTAMPEVKRGPLVTAGQLFGQPDAL